jgi:hypothetical protein
LFLLGLGCMQFLPTASPDQLTIAEYCTNLDKFLRSINAVGHLNVDLGFVKDAFWSGTLPLLENNECIWPGTGLEIQMRLHIPFRVQEELRSGLSADAGSEDFLVSITHRYYSPISVITPMCNDRGIRGSDAVYLVRKFLERIIKEKPSADFFLDYLGPSPFHADFVICEQNTGGVMVDAIYMEHKRRRGYDNILWHVDTKQVSFEKATEMILEQVADDTDIFYAIIQGRSALLRAWIDVGERAQDVIDIEHERSFIRWLPSHAKKTRHIKEAIMKLAEYQMRDIATRSELTTTLG